MRVVRDLLDRYEPLLAEALGAPLLAAWLEGATSIPLPDDDGWGPPIDPDEVLFDEGDEPLTRWPMIEEAARQLISRRLLLRHQFDQLASSAKAEAFTMAHVASVDALEKVRAALVEDVERGGTLRQFRERVEEAVEDSKFSPWHVETVYRTTIGVAHAKGLQKVLEHPLVSDEFPYLEYSATHDSRTRPNHLALETLGLNGTAVYRRDDPIWTKFLPPWGFNCRCVAIPLSLEDAAAKGVKEAQEWLARGWPPERPEHVPPPPFLPEGGFVGPGGGT